MTDASDAQVIAAVLDGAIDRYAELVEKYQDQAIRLAFSLLGDYEDAREVSQEAFVAAYRALGRFRGEAKFSTWLHRIVVNGCKDAWRRQRRRPSIAATIASQPPSDAGDQGLFVDVDDPVAGPREQLANRELSRRISDGIQGLPMKQRAAFLLHHVEGLPLEEVARVMRCRIGTVKSHVFRATMRLRQELAPWAAREGWSV
jgi:RNA polymerase sigma-70 factor (ECF subfamily)